MEEMNEIDLAEKVAKVAQKEYDAEKKLETKTKQKLPEYIELKKRLCFLKSQARATNILLRELIRKDETERLKALRLFKDEKWKNFRDLTERAWDEEQLKGTMK